VKSNTCIECCLPYAIRGEPDWKIPMVPDDWVCPHLIEIGKEIKAKAILACENRQRWSEE